MMPCTYVKVFVLGTAIGRRLDAGGLTLLGPGQHTWWCSVHRMDRLALVCPPTFFLLCKYDPQFIAVNISVSHVLLPLGTPCHI